MILNHINYKMPIYKDCTLGELMIVGTVVFIGTSLTFSLITRLLFNFAWIGFAVAILLLVPLTKLVLSQLQKIKFDKPYGYYQQLLFKKIQNYSLFNHLFRIAFIQRKGKWSVRREE